MAGIFDSENDRSVQHLRLSVQGILQRVDALPTVDPAHAEEILGYDEHGLPR